MAVVAAGQGVERVSFQERVERSRGGRVLISLFVVVTVLTVLTANLPPSHLQTLLQRADHPYLNGAFLSQDWGVFAPDPRSQTVDIFARVTFADGSHETWQIPARNPVVGEYIDYRWRKWEEWVASPSLTTPIFRPGAIYAARRLATPDRRPVRVVLLDRSHAIAPPGKPPTPLPTERAIYTTKITPAMLRGASP